MSLSADAREARVARALREIGAALGPSEDLDDILELVLAKTQELLESERATLYLLDEGTGELVSRIVGGGQVRSIRMRVGYGIAGIVAQTGKPIRVRDAYADPRFEAHWDVLTGFRTRNTLATPLKNHSGSTVGVLQVLNKRRLDEFTEDDEALLVALSTQAAVAIDNSRLVLRLKENYRALLDTQQTLERRVRDLQLMYELERSTAHATSLPAIIEAVFRHLVPACRARAGAALIAEEESGDLALFVWEPDVEQTLTRRATKSRVGLLGSAMQSSEPRILGAAELQLELSEAVLSFTPEIAISAPLDGESSPLGAIAVLGQSGHEPPGEDDVELVRLVSANVSTAIRLQRAATARERSERLTTIGSLLSQVVHDFKTPMTVISGYAQLMVDIDDRTQRSDYAEEILKQFDVITSMQREVLEFARGQRTLFVRRVYLGKFFDELTSQIGLEIAGTLVMLELDVDRKGMARFDESRLSRALHNLVRNAIEAMGSVGGTVTLRAVSTPASLVIEVRDTGPGIPPQVEGRLFQSFVTANKQGGTGLGLAIVKKIVDEHGGSIRVESSSKGASFTIELPQAPVVQGTRAGKRPSNRPPAPRS